MNDKPKLDSFGNIIIKNRAFKRRFKNRAQLEDRPSKKWYTKKKINVKKRRNRAKNSR